ncbi:hypothetical protein [Bordetella petrii]|uniref:hypothetical protein n=1 Tax=Bordetella petrii TaxID=94624 RepID=UPI001A9587B0|nr:hypothetical protein [Bordetella petrii]MBO1111847.1 hypothetical protein [Bordetella petrii]
MRKLILFTAILMVLGGCATKNYGRQGEVTDFEKQTLTCREIELEQAKVHGYLAHIEKESEFDARSVLSFLGDFGMGNVMEKNAALEAANTRLSQLQTLSVQKGCSAAIPSPPPSALPTPPQDTPI